MSSGWIDNPAYLPEFSAALDVAMGLKLVEMEGYAQANASWSSSIPGTIQGAFLGAHSVGMGFGPGSKGPLFEHGTTDRYTGSGAYRGVGPARPMLGPAAETAMSTPLALVI
jgi:hypothetical protein